MEEVQRPKPKHFINFEKILKKTNRSSLRPKKNQRENNEDEKLDLKKMPLKSTWNREKLMNSLKLSRSRIAFSERSIPLKLM